MTLFFKRPLTLLNIALFSLFFFSHCQQVAREASIDTDSANGLDQDKVQEIITKAIQKHGNGHYNNLSISFDFRKFHYTASRKHGQFTYTRTFSDSSNQLIHDVLTNDGFTRSIAGSTTTVDGKKAHAYSNSINSVVYFTLLPAFLKDPAVHASYLGSGNLFEKTYHKIKITFSEAGGGDDFQDEYIYWIHQEDMTVDYLAYNFLENDGGARFRKAIDRQVIDGIIFQNYINYKPNTDSRDVATFDELFENGGMTELSRIENKNIQVELLTPAI